MTRVRVVAIVAVIAAGCAHCGGKGGGAGAGGHDEARAGGDDKAGAGGHHESSGDDKGGGKVRTSLNEVAPTGTATSATPSTAAAPAGGDELDKLIAPRALTDPTTPDPTTPNPTMPDPTTAGPDRPPAATAAITVQGVARDAASGAIVQVDGGKVWTIAGLGSWPAELRNQRVEVTGVATIRKLAPDPVRGPDGTVSHGMVGTSDVLAKARWRAL